MNIKELSETIGLEEHEYLEMIEMLVETGTADLNRLQSAIDEENVQGVVEAAHSIKGASVNLGLLEVYEIAREIEDKALNDRLEGITESVQVLKKKLEMIAELSCG